MLDDTNPITSFEGHFDTLQEELDWMIRAQSLLQFTTAERAKRPLDDWSYGPNFFDSLRECEHGNMSHASLIRTMVFVLMGNEATQKACNSIDSAKGAAAMTRTAWTRKAT